MALWAKVQQLPPELVQQVTAIYGEHFPLEVRHVMAPFIERNMWSEVTPGHPEQDMYAAQAVGALLQEMRKKADGMTSNEFILRMSLLAAADRFQEKYNGNPVALYKIIQKCLHMEMQVVNDASSAQAHGKNQASEITTALGNVRKSVTETLAVLRKMASEHDTYAHQYHECTKHKVHIQTLAGKPMDQERSDKEMHLKTVISQLETSLSVMASELLQAHLNLADMLEKNIASLNMLQCRVLDDELIAWKREQQLCGNGASMVRCINTIQEWCEHLADLIWQTRNQVKDAETLEKKLLFASASGVPDKLPHIEKQVDRLLTTLVTSMFVIERQPPQVMKTNTKFTAKVRMLVGGQLNVFRTPPQVKVSIISEAQAQARVRNEQIGGAVSGKQSITEMCGEIESNIASMEYKSATRELSVDFRNMKLCKIKRAEKKGTESVMDEKFTLLFKSQFNVGGELNYQVWTLSLPVVVIVHGVQESHGLATVTWDNAFTAPARIPFAVPDKVTWGQLAETLNLKFASASGHPLSEDNLRFLGQKMFRSMVPLNPSELYMKPASFSQFCKEPLPGRSFTFWEWFYMVMKVTKDHLRSPWTNGLIEGFIPKKLAEDKLAMCPMGTFLLRFSDSELGAITIAWAGESQHGTGQPEVFNLQPFSACDLKLRGLGDRIADLAQLTWLYPDVPKEQAFGKYYTATEHNPNSVRPYVKACITMQIPGWRQCFTPSNASSPIYSMRSPDSQRDTPSANGSYGASPLPRYGATPASEDMEYKYEDSEQVNSFDQYEFQQLPSFDMGAALLPNGLMSRSHQ